MGSETQGGAVDLRAARDAAVDSGLPHGTVLLAFADAVLGDDEGALAAAREALASALGGAALVDAAAIVAAFQCVDRIADATGIPLDAAVDAVSQDVQEELDLRSFGSAASTPTRALVRAVGRALVPLRARLMGVAARWLR